MKDPGDATDLPNSAGLHIPTNAFGRPVPPMPATPPSAPVDPEIHKQAMEHRAAVEKYERRHRPASTVAGICSGAIGSAVINTSLTQASFACLPLRHPPQVAAWCPIVTGPYFDVTTWTLVLSFALAFLAYWAVYAVIHLSDG